MDVGAADIVDGHLSRAADAPHVDSTQACEGTIRTELERAVPSPPPMLPMTPSVASGSGSVGRFGVCILGRS